MLNTSPLSTVAALSSNALDNGSMDALARTLYAFPDLQLLDLRSNAFTSAVRDRDNNIVSEVGQGVARVLNPDVPTGCAARPLAQLRELHLSHNDLAEATSATLRPVLRYSIRTVRFHS